MAVTIKQIAEAAGVSRGTVDRALKGRYGVKPEVAAKVKKIADELGYKPNLVAKALSDRQYAPKKIGIILVTENNSFYDEILDGAKAALREYEDFGIENMIKIQVDYADFQQQIATMEEMAEQGVGVIVMTPINCTEVSEEIDKLVAQGIQIVTINSDIADSGRMAYVGCHHRKSGFVLAELLGLMANDREMEVGVIAGPIYNLAVMRRKKGLLESVAASYKNIRITALYENESNEKQSYKITKALLDNYPTLQTLCVLGAGMKGSLKAIHDCKLEGKLKVVMYDMIPEVKAALENGTVQATITQEPFKQGYEGVQLAARYLAYGRCPEQVLNYTELAIVTKSCLYTAP